MSFKHSEFKIIPPVIGHRGASAYAPENTLSSFLKAKQLGVKWIEFDVQMTVDNELVVFHDNEISRTTNGKGSIHEHSLSYLKSLDAGSWFDIKFSAEKIPTLQEVIFLAQEFDLGMNIEIKHQTGNATVVAEKLITILLDNLKIKPFQYFISSFDTAILDQIKLLNPSLPIAHLADVWSHNWQQEGDDLNCIAFDLNYKSMTEQNIRDMLATNRLVIAYTVNDPILATELFSWGVSAVFSDCPDKIISVINRI